jgi:hypothetical protein
VKATDLSAGEFQLEFSDGTTYTLQAANSTLADQWIDAIEPRIEFARSQARKRGSLVPGSDGGGRGGAAAGVGDWGGSDAGSSRGGRSNSRGAAAGGADDDEDGGRGGRRRRPTHRASSSGFVDAGTRRQDDFDGIDDDEPPAAAARGGRGGGKPGKSKPEPVPDEDAEGSGDSDGAGRRGARKPLRGAGKSGKTASDDDGLTPVGAAAAVGGAAAGSGLGRSRAPSPVKSDTGRKRSDDSEVSPAAKPTLLKPKPEPEAGSDADSDAGGRGGKANGTSKPSGGSATPAMGRLGAASRPALAADTDEDEGTDGSEDGGRRGRGGRRAEARVASASGLPPAPSRKGWVFLRPTTRFGREARWYLTLAGGFLTMSSDADAAASAVSSQDVADILAVMPSTSGLRGGFSLLSRGDKQKRKFRAEDEAASREWIAAIRDAKAHRERAKELRAAALTSKGAAGAGASGGKGRAKPRRRSSGGSVGADTDEDGEGRSARTGKRPASRKPLARADSDEEEDKGAFGGLRGIMQRVSVRAEAVGLAFLWSFVASNAPRYCGWWSVAGRGDC